MPDSTPLRSGFVSLALFRCDRWRAKITVAACAKKYAAAQGTGAEARQHAHCVGCPIGPEHTKLAAVGETTPRTAPVAAAVASGAARRLQVVQEPPGSAGGAGAPPFEPVQTPGPAEIPVLGHHVAEENAPPTRARSR